MYVSVRSLFPVLAHTYIYAGRRHAEVRHGTSVEICRGTLPDNGVFWTRKMAGSGMDREGEGR